MLKLVRNKSVISAIVTRRFAFAVCVTIAVPAGAQAPPSTMRMACADAMALVKRDGSAVLSWPAGKPEKPSRTEQPGRTERFVSDRSQCGMTEIAELRFVPTRDNLECPVGYRCREPDYGDWDWP
ncbi:hypothetical protein MBUL_00077 [Methylobacterium bullatum]|uniref:Ig-like domain-containing protein n=1 Tax=Methylobacterium bullatum TaxID=570505 RepID=A0A679IXH9_9HYPH|nr:hypothetical protein MBUL_00077 [Methylobacterium bullatum]